MNNKNIQFDLSQLTPELMEQFMEFYENLQATKVEEVKQEPKSKVKGKNQLLKPTSRATLRSKYKGDAIELVNMTSGSVTMGSKKSHMIYQWDNYEDVDYVEFDDLMHNVELLKRGLVAIVEYEQYSDIIEVLGLENAMTFAHYRKNIGDFVKLDVNEMGRTFESFSREAQNELMCAIISQAKDEDSSLYDSVRLRNKVCEALGLDSYFLE